MCDFNDIMKCMKSQVIKVRNLPFDMVPLQTLRVKPIGLLAVMLILGIYILFFQPMMRMMGIILCMIAPFALVALPDRHLIHVYRDCMVLFNQRDHSSCMLIYWDDVVNWQYEWHRMSDQFVVKLVDGSSESIEVYSKRPIRKFMSQYCPDKEIRTTRLKGAGV